MRTRNGWIVVMVVTAGCGPETYYESVSNGPPVASDRGQEQEPTGDFRTVRDAAEDPDGPVSPPDAGMDKATMDEDRPAAKPDGCIPCSAEKIAGHERVGCRLYTCEDGCLVEGWVENMGACNEPAKCLVSCSTGDTRPECGVCICDGDDCAMRICVTADLDARNEPDQDGCKGTPCRTAVCSQVEHPDGGKTWQCIEGPDMPDGEACDDNDPCTLETTCQAGQCIGTPMDCDDQNPCSDDSCREALCEHQVVLGRLCDDGDPCTDEDRCQADGTCLGVARTCVPADACHRAFCEGGACLEEPLDGAACDDQDPCTEGDTCVAGACAGHPVTCEPDAPCLTTRTVVEAGACRCLNTVLPGFCFFQIGGTRVCVEVGQTDPTGCFACIASQEVTPKFLAGKFCDDGDPCTVGDLCSATAKRCQGTPVLVDPEPLPCQHPECDGQTPVVGVATDDGYCVHDGKCYPEGAKVSACLWCGKEGGTWRVLPVDSGTPCEDGNPCTWGDACDNAGTCKSGWVYSCEPPAGGCAVTTCDGKGGCTEPQWVPTSGKCLVQWGGQYSCLARGESLPGMICKECDPAKDPRHLVPSAPGLPCDPLDCCRKGGSCDGQGNCIAGPPVACDDGNPCTLDYCVTADCPGFPGAPPACGHKPTTEPKTCQDPCGQTGTCVNGVCQTSLPCNACPPGKCDDQDPCTDDACDPATGTCLNTPVDCEDKDPCTQDSCKDGACTHEALDCDDQDPCTDDACNLLTGQCEHLATTGPSCDDQNPCTHQDACHAGVCRGIEVECPDTGRLCHTATCNPSTGTCVESEVSDTTPCDDDNPCDARDQCWSGACLGLGACNGSATFSGSQVVRCEGVPLLGQTLTIQANIRWDDPSGPQAFQTVASLVGQDINGKPHGVEFLVGTATSPSAGYCAPARRPILRVIHHGQSFLVGYTAQVKVPVGEWTLIAVTIGSGGVAFVVGNQVVTHAIRCDTGAPVTTLDLPQVPSLTARIGGLSGPDGSVTSGARMVVSDLTVWDLVVPPGPPSYAYPNLWCLFVEEIAFEHHEVRPVLALRFNYEDQTLIQEGLSGATCLLGTDPGPDPADPTFLFGGEPFRTGCPSGN